MPEKKPIVEVECPDCGWKGMVVLGKILNVYCPNGHKIEIQKPRGSVIEPPKAEKEKSVKKRKKK